MKKYTWQKTEHIGILNAVLNNDKNQAILLLQQHLERAREEIIGLYGN